MRETTKASTYVYPNIGSQRDLWFVRLSGHGIGNSFYTYFHAVTMAEKTGAKIITPAWFSIKPSRILTWDRSKRLYWRMFKPFEGEIHGLHKALVVSANRNRVFSDISNKDGPRLIDGAFNIITNNKFNFSFNGLHEHRDAIRKRILGIMNDPIPQNHTWGKSGFIAVHIRLGDFTQITDPKLVSSGTANTRIPLSWYVNLVVSLNKRYPDMPVYLFSDGSDEELAPLLQIGAMPYRSGSDMTDLLALSSASILVGSNSTYSRWAAFLGDMPSIWLKRKIEDEKPSAINTPILFVPFDEENPAIWEK